ANAGLCGTYHATAAGQTSWHGYACHAIEFARRAGKSVKVAPDAIEAVPSSAFITAAKRPHNSRLDSRKFSAAFGLSLPRWELGVERMLAELLDAN
ncbi:MAG: sugar nucleotide-binding protein, partial [Burkholderiaceae bacterium]